MEKERYRCVLARDGASRLPDHIFRKITHIRHPKGVGLGWYCYNKVPFKVRADEMRKKAKEYWEKHNKNLPFWKRILNKIGL